MLWRLLLEFIVTDLHHLFFAGLRRPPKRPFATALAMMGQLRKRTFAHSATLVMRELCCITMLGNPSKQVGHPHHGLDPPSDRDPRR